MVVDHSANYLFSVNTEAVTLSLIRQTTTTVVIDNALRGAIDRTDERSLQVLQDTAETAFNLPGVQVNPAANGRVVRRDDTITDADGVVWSIVSVRLIECGTAWRAVCKRMGGV